MKSITAITKFADGVEGSAGIMVENLLKNKRFIKVMLVSLIWGLIAHGMAIFNKFAFQDESEAMDSLGVTFVFGRWMLGIIDKLETFFRGEIWSTSTLNGMATVLALGAIAYVVIEALHIRSRALMIITAGILVSWPAITSMMGFMFTVPYYYIGLMIAFAALFMWLKQQSLMWGIVASFAMACSMGLYQVNIGACLALICLYFIQYTYENDLTIKDYFILALKQLAVLVATLVEYVLFNKICLRIEGLSMSSYGAMDFGSMGATSLSGYLMRIATVYKEFFNPTTGVEASMYYYNNTYFLWAGLVICGIMLFALFASLIYKKNYIKSLELLLLIVVFPLASHFVYFMVDAVSVRARMAYAESFVYVFMIVVIHMTVSEYEGFDLKAVEKGLTLLCKALICAIALVLLGNLRLDNACYLKATMMQTADIGYFNQLIAQIKSCEGYNADAPVCYINADTMVSIRGTGDRLDEIMMVPYERPTCVAAGNWKNFMSIWCGFQPEEIDPSFFDGYSEVEEMPSYPAYGSIKKLEGVIVVKF